MLPLFLLITPALAAAAADNTADSALIAAIWQGVQQAQDKTASACGTITETRTSELLAKPLVFRGTFCAEGFDKFSVEYSEPSPVRVRFNKDYVNVTAGLGGKRTEVFQVGQHVRRAQAHFSRSESLANIKQYFSVTASQDGRSYGLRLVPNGGRYRERLNQISITFDKATFLPTRIEVDGRSGVRSVFAIQIKTVNGKIDPAQFQVYRP